MRSPTRRSASVLGLGLGLLLLAAGPATRAISVPVLPPGIPAVGTYQILAPAPGAPHFEDCGGFLPCGADFEASGTLELRLFVPPPPSVPGITPGPQPAFHADLDLGGVAITGSGSGGGNTGQRAVDLFLSLDAVIGLPVDTVGGFEFFVGDLGLGMPVTLEASGGVLTITGGPDFSAVDGPAETLNLRAVLVPEPATSGLLAAGLLALATRGARSR